MSRSCRRRPYARALAATVLAVASSVAAPADPRGTGTSTLEQLERVRVRTVAVRIEASGEGAPGACLDFGADDLEVRLRGQPVEGPAGVRLDRRPRPTVHALVVDTSASMAGRLERVREAAAVYVRSLDLDRDRAMVVAFDDSVVRVAGVTADRDALLEALDTVRMGRMTSMLDALHATILELDGHGRRPVVVLLTDGVDTGSLHERTDVRTLVDGRPDLAVFTVGLGLPLLGSGGPPGLDSTKKFLQALAGRSNGRFFDVPTGSGLPGVYARIRELLDNEASLTVLDPEPSASPGRLRVRSRRADCRVEMLHPREAPADDPRTRPVDVPAGPPFRISLPADELDRPDVDTVPPGRDEACPPGHGSAPESGGFLDVRTGRLTGCVFDVTQDYGLLYEPFRPTLTHVNTWLGLRTRAIDLPLGPVDRLPRTPESLMEILADAAVAADGRAVDRDPRLVPAAEHARPYHDVPLFLNGLRWLELRSRLSLALYADPGYRAWALDRIRREAREDVGRLRQRYRAWFPGASDEAVDAVVRSTDEGRAALARLGGPDPADVQGRLGAWLGDVPAHDLFARWDRDLANRGDGGPGEWDRAVERWSALRRLLFVPSYARVLAVLLPGRDADGERIGFWRIVLPRPAWVQMRMRGYRRDPDRSDLPLDLVPDVPFGLWLRRHLEAADADAWRGLRVARVAYQPLGPPRKHDPARAFRRVRVELALIDPARPGAAGVVVVGDVRLAPGATTPSVDDVRVRGAAGDPSGLSGGASGG